MHKLAIFATTVALIAASDAGAGAVVQEVSYSGGSERVLFLDPGKPKATVILLVGGDGAIKLASDGAVGDGGNFLAHTREHWATKGIAVVLPDIPHGIGTLLGRRQNAGYAAAVAALVDFAKSRNPVPVFLVGHSQGTNGVVSAASRLPSGTVAGIVLASSIIEPENKPDMHETVFDANLSAITAPVLILADEGDSCPLSAPREAPRIQAALTHAVAVKIVTVSGDKAGPGGPCDSDSGHGFYGVENSTVNKIANWIEAILAQG
jgi:pimeloyl-ACP methyl ester carboxylesterase